MPTRARGGGPKAGARTAGRKTARGATDSASPRRRKAVPSSEDTPAAAASDFLIDEGLTTQQFTFVEALCADTTRPAVDAARTAYPDQTYDSLRVTASRLLADANIRAAINRRLAPQVHKRRTSTEQVTKVIGEGIHWDPAVIYNDDGSIKPVRDWPADARRQLASVEVNEITIGSGASAKVIGVTKKVRFASREGYVALGARMNKMLTDRLQVDDKTGLADRLAKARSRKAG